MNGEDLTQASHYKAQQVLGHYFPVCRLTIYREKAEENRPIEKEGKTQSVFHLLIFITFDSLNKNTDPNLWFPKLQYVLIIREFFSSEILKITLGKVKGKQLGIKLVGKR